MLLLSTLNVQFFLFTRVHPLLFRHTVLPYFPLFPLIQAVVCKNLWSPWKLGLYINNWIELIAGRLQVAGPCQNRELSSMFSRIQREGYLPPYPDVSLKISCFVATKMAGKRWLRRFLWPPPDEKVSSSAHILMLFALKYELRPAETCNCDVWARR